MKFSENDFKFSFSSQTDFLRSVTVGLIFVPLHFICDIARKSVFLRREKIEKWILGSVYFSLAVTILTLAYYIYAGHVYVFDGSFPLIIPILSAALLFAAYALFRGSAFKLYDDLQDFVFLDSALTESVNEFKSEEIANEVEQEIIIEDRVPEQEAAAEPVFDTPIISEAGKTEAVSAVTATEKMSDTIVPKVFVAASESELNLGHDLEAELAQAMDAAFNEPNTTVRQSEKVVQSSSAVLENQSVFVSMSREARKSVYKNVILSALNDKLENVKSTRKLPDKRVQSAFENQVYVKVTDFSISSIKQDINDILSQEPME